MQDITPVLSELVERILSSEQPIAKIVLFGSYAKGTAGEESDIDLMVIIDSLTKKQELSSYRLYAIGDRQNHKSPRAC
ncbi:MAG: nucleotidyltransferase domain-containing protein [Planctomycetaceae bacterium]|jgi:predicted nucleotidyltransferase|nr:nucleotidyltransferase domain-containing protein [Planctomycetaceae bacterium]